MFFNSLQFVFLFVPATLAGYFWLGKIGRQLAPFWLAAASLVFYASWNPEYIPLLLASVAFNYLIGLLILHSAARPRRRNWLLALGVAVDLLVLAYYKYLHWFSSIAHSLGLAETDFGAGIALPLGISFFTFTQIGYLVECRQGLAEDPRWVNYLVFVTNFPHLIAGPIIRSSEVMPQLIKRSTFRFNPGNLAVGLSIFVMGLAKKILIADNLAPFVDAGFREPQGLLLFSAWGAALAYALQLYFDFSGYSDMAIGLARLFNLRFPLNFYSPYKATCIIDFWQRWHMTLSRFLRDYLYIPLGGNRKGRTRRYVNLMATMLLGGLWHGANWTFLIWGGLHGLFLMINHLWRALRPARAAPPAAFAAAVFSAFQVLLTFLAVVVAFVFFRAPSLAAALHVLAGMAGLHGAEAALVLPASLAALLRAFGRPLAESGLVAFGNGAPLYEAGLIAASIAIVWFAPNVHQIMGRYSPALTKIEPTPATWLRWRPNLGWALAAAVVAAAAIFGVSEHVVFLYAYF